MGAPILKEALRAFRDETDFPPQEARWLSPACWAAADLWDHDTWTLGRYEEAMAALRRQVIDPFNSDWSAASRSTGWGARASASSLPVPI